MESIKTAMKRTGSLNEGIEDKDIHAMIEDNDVKHMHKLNYEQFKIIFIKKEQERIATIRGAAKGTMSVRDRIGPAKGV
jgi:hypothetical protein